MAPPFPPKPKIGPLVRRSLFAAVLGVPGCQQAVRIGVTPPVRIGAEEVAAPADAGPVVVPAANVDAGATRPVRPPPVRIGPPVRRDPIRIGRAPEPIRIGAEPVPRSSSLIRGAATDADGRPLAHASLRVELASGARIVSTDAGGAFSLDGLPPGSHEVVVHADGFAPVRARLVAARDPGAITLSFAPA